MKDCLCSLYMSVCLSVCLSHRSIASKQQRFAAALPQPGAGVTKYFDPEINRLPQGVTACKPDYSAIYLDHSTGNHYDCAQSLTSI